MGNESLFHRESLYEMKLNGALPEWESITEAQLLELYSHPPILDAEVAQLFGVSIGQVRCLRKKFNVNDKRVHQRLKEAVNAESKARLLSPEHADGFAIALAHFIYRDGPIEDFHANGQLTDKDMMAQNKFTANRIAALLHLMKTDQWAAMEMLLFLYMKNGDNWDAPVIDFEELRAALGFDVSQ